MGSACCLMILCPALPSQALFSFPKDCPLLFLSCLSPRSASLPFSRSRRFPRCFFPHSSEAPFFLPALSQARPLILCFSLSCPLPLTQYRIYALYRRALGMLGSCRAS